MHQSPEFSGALFQVASQFNLLEMASSSVTPEQGVTRYQHDQTQGPACAIAAGAATIYRNYFAPLHGGEGQTAERQLDCLGGIGAALADALVQPVEYLWTMKNGYALCSAEGLRMINAYLGGLDASAIDALRGLLRIGNHQVPSNRWKPLLTPSGLAGVLLRASSGVFRYLLRRCGDRSRNLCLKQPMRQPF